MAEQGIHPSDDTYANIFRTCGNVKEVEKVSSIHSHTVGSGLKVGNALINMYVELGTLQISSVVFDKMH